MGNREFEIIILYNYILNKDLASSRLASHSIPVFPTSWNYWPRELYNGALVSHTGHLNDRRPFNRDQPRAAACNLRAILMPTITIDSQPVTVVHIRITDLALKPPSVNTSSSRC